MVDLLLIMVVLAAVVVFVTAPLRRTPRADGLPSDPVTEESSELRELEAARDAKLRELRDAELDHRTGKLSDEDYGAVDATLRAEAIEILRALDEVRERTAAQHGQDRESAGGRDRESAGGRDRESAGGRDRESAGGRDRESAGGQDRQSADGQNRQSADTITD